MRESLIILMTYERFLCQMDTVSFYIILATTYENTFLFGLYSDCETFTLPPNWTRSPAYLFLWSRPQGTSNGLHIFVSSSDERDLKFV